MKAYGIAATLAFAYAALMFGQSIGDGTVMAAMGAAAARATNDGAVLAVSSLVGVPVQVITLALATRMTEEDLFAYLGLDVPRRREAAVAVAGLVLLIVATDGLALAFGRDVTSKFELDIHRSALAEGALLPLWIAIIVVAPAGEEILFRGFLFRGFIHEPPNILPGILAISLIWAALHFQYDWIGTLQVFVFGVYLGLVRLWSGSTTLTILLHMLTNIVSVAETLLALGWV